MLVLGTNFPALVAGYVFKAKCVGNFEVPRFEDRELLVTPDTSKLLSSLKVLRRRCRRTVGYLHKSELVERVDRRLRERSVSRRYGTLAEELPGAVYCDLLDFPSKYEVYDSQMELRAALEREVEVVPGEVGLVDIYEDRACQQPPVISLELRDGRTLRTRHLINCAPAPAFDAILRSETTFFRHCPHEWRYLTKRLYRSDIDVTGGLLEKAREWGWDRVDAIDEMEFDSVEFGCGWFCYEVSREHFHRISGIGCLVSEFVRPIGKLRDHVEFGGVLHLGPGARWVNQRLDQTISEVFDVG